MDPPEEKRNLDPPEKSRNWRRPVTAVVDFFICLLMFAWTTTVIAFISWIFDGLNNGLDRLERYVLPEYEVLPPVYKPLTAEEYAGLPLRMYEAMRRDLQMQHRTARAERRSRPYDDPKLRKTQGRESSPEINVGASTSGQATESSAAQGGPSSSDLQPQADMGTSQQSKGLENLQPPPPLSPSQQTQDLSNPQSPPPQYPSQQSQGLYNQQSSPPLSTSQQLQGLDNPQPSPPHSSSQQSQGFDNSQPSSSQYYSLSGMWDPSLWPGETTISAADPTSQPLDKSSSLKKVTEPPTDSSTSSSVATTDHSENSSSNEAFGTGNDLPIPEPPLSPGINVDADTIHFSGGAVWESPSPVQSPQLFSEDDFLKITSELPVTSGNENLGQGLMSVDVCDIPTGLTAASVLGMASGTASQQLPGMSQSLSPGINVGASTSFSTGGSVLDASPPPMSSPPLFSQDDFEKMMSDLPGTSESGKADQSDSPLSTDIVDATSNRLSVDTGLETTGPSASSLPSFSEGDYARTTSPQCYPSFSKFGDVASPGGTIGYRGSSADTTASLSDVKSGVCTAERPAGAEGDSEIPEVVSPDRTIGYRGSCANFPASSFDSNAGVCAASAAPTGAEGGSEIEEVHTRHGRTIRTIKYVSLSDEDIHSAPRKTYWSDEEIRSSSVEDLRSETSKLRRLKFRRRSRPLREAVPRSTRIQNLLDRMDVQATEEQVQETAQSTTRNSPNNSKQESEDDNPEE